MQRLEPFVTLYVLHGFYMYLPVSYLNVKVKLRTSPSEMLPVLKFDKIEKVRLHDD
jgi:hypothetical protein